MGSFRIVANPPAFGGRLPHFALFSRTFPQRESSPAFSCIRIFPQKIGNEQVLRVLVVLSIKNLEFLTHKITISRGLER